MRFRRKNNTFYYYPEKEFEQVEGPVALDCVCVFLGHLFYRCPAELGLLPSYASAILNWYASFIIENKEGGVMSDDPARWMSVSGDWV